MTLPQIYSTFGHFKASLLKTEPDPPHIHSLVSSRTRSPPAAYYYSLQSFHHVFVWAKTHAETRTGTECSPDVTNCHEDNHPESRGSARREFSPSNR